MLQGELLQNVMAQNLGLACSRLQPAVAEVSELSHHFSVARDSAWRVREALQSVSEPSIFPDVTLPRANGREGVLVDFRTAQPTLPP